MEIDFSKWEKEDPNIDKKYNIKGPGSYYCPEDNSWIDVDCDGPFRAGPIEILCNIFELLRIKMTSLFKQR